MKNLNWSDEPYVKVYTRDTAEWRRLSMEARGLYLLLYRAVDRAGVIALGEMGADEVGDAVAVLLHGDASKTSEWLADLVKRKFVVVVAKQGELSLVVPDYVAAQNARTADRLRVQQSRERRRDEALSSGKAASPPPPPTPARRYTQTHVSHDVADVTLDQTRRDRSEEIREISPIGESEGDKPPRTDPTPSLLGQKFDEAVGRGPASWGMDGSGPSKSDPAKDQIHPTPKPAAPAPPSPRPAPRVAVVDPKPIPSPDPPLGALFGGAAPEPPAPAPKGTTKRKPAARKSEEPVEIPLPKDWAPNDGHYKLAAEKYGFQKKHVDFLAEEMRDKCEAKGVKQVNWDAKFRTWMGNAWKWNDGKPPVVPDPPPPPEPKRRVPPPPPLDPIVAAGAERARKRMESGEIINPLDLFKKVGMRFPEEPELALEQP